MASTTREQLQVDLPTVASICDWTGVSDRVAVAIASAVLKMLEWLQENKSKVIDRMKIWWPRAKNRRKAMVSSFNQVRENKGSFFDGRKDKTIARKKGNNFTKRLSLKNIYH